MSLLIKNAVIINADKMSSKPQDILIDKGKIARIGTSIKADKAKSIDASGKYVLPGLIDIHVHFRTPGQEHKETIETGSRAAVKGGFTTVMCMPNTTPVIDNEMIVEGIFEEARRVGLCHVIPIGAITRGQSDQDLVDIFELKEAGCLALSDDGKSVVNSLLMRRAMEYAKMAGILLIEHCEDPLISQCGVMHEGDVSTYLGLKGQPGISETIIVARDIELSRHTGAAVHMAHMSLARSVDLIRQAKKDGIRITAEACPHHFTLTEEDVKDFNTSKKMNPPLRTKEDVAAIKEGLKDGTIDCIVTDHAPHTVEDKERDFEHAPFGMIGLETSLSLGISELIQPGILTWPQLVERMSRRPAEIVGLEKKGRIEEGWDADVTIVDPKERWIVRIDDIASKSQNTPFLGQEMTGRVKTTIFGGKVVFGDK